MCERWTRRNRSVSRTVSIVFIGTCSKCVADVQSDVVLRRFDPLHLLDGHEDGALARSDGETLEPLGRVRDRVEHGPHLSGVLLLRHSAQPAGGTVERQGEALLRDRFEQVVHRRNLEGPDGVLVVRRDEDHRGHALCPDGVDHREAIDARHLHVEQHEIRLPVLNQRDRLAPVSRRQHGLDARLMIEQQLHAVPRQRLVVHHEDRQRHGSSSGPAVWTGSVMITRTPRFGAGSTTRRASPPYSRARRFLVFVRPIPA